MPEGRSIKPPCFEARDSAELLRPDEVVSLSLNRAPLQIVYDLDVHGVFRSKLAPS